MIDISHLPEQTGIYLIKHKNQANRHCYVGQAINIYNRFKSHHLVDYKNPNNPQYNGKLYRAIRKYGWDAFEVQVLELCEIIELDNKEIQYISQYDSFHNGYNGTAGGQFWAPNIHSPEIEEKRRQTREKNQSLMNEKHPRAKLTNDEVIQIRQRYIDGESVKEIYIDYQDLYSNIDSFRNIVIGNTYKTVGNIPDKKIKRAQFGVKLTENEVKEIRKRYNTEHISYAKLGKEYNVSASTIQKVIRKEGYYSYIE